MSSKILVAESEGKLPKQPVDAFGKPIPAFIVNKNCRRCYGRGYIGTNVKTGGKVPCPCLKPFKQEEELDEKGNEAED